MKYIQNLFLVTIFSLTSIFALGCHDISLTETSAVDNGDGTFTYTFEVCFGTEAGSETYGFWLDFTGGNLLSYDASVTGPTTGNVKNASVPPVSGSGTIEYGDWDDTADPLLSGTANLDCLPVTLTFDAPLTDVTFGGTQAGFLCDSISISTSSCFIALTTSGTVTDASTGCASDGEITATPDNGAGPYSYSWDNGATGSTITNLAPGDYEVTVTDDNGCVTTSTFTVGPAPDYIVEISADDCNGDDPITWDIEDTNGDIIGSGSQIQNGSTQTYSVCGCGVTFNITVGEDRNCDGTLNPDATVTASDGTTYSTTSSDSISLDCTLLPVESDESEVVFDEHKNANRISWSTLSEQNNDYFTISYSNNGETWEEIQKVSGAGNSNVRMEYEAYHRSFQNNQINYYKVVQTDYDGTAKNVAILSVDNRTDKELIKILNLMGQEVDSDYKGVLIRYYSDGSTEKVYSH